MTRRDEVQIHRRCQARAKLCRCNKHDVPCFCSGTELAFVVSACTPLFALRSAWRVEPPPHQGPARSRYISHSLSPLPPPPRHAHVLKAKTSFAGVKRLVASSLYWDASHTIALATVFLQRRRIGRSRIRGKSTGRRRAQLPFCLDIRSAITYTHHGDKYTTPTDRPGHP